MTDDTQTETETESGEQTEKNETRERDKHAILTEDGSGLDDDFDLLDDLDGSWRYRRSSSEWSEIGDVHVEERNGEKVLVFPGTRVNPGSVPYRVRERAYEAYREKPDDPDHEALDPRNVVYVGHDYVRGEPYAKGKEVVAEMREAEGEAEEAE